jgi:hypothetical protein
MKYEKIKEIAEKAGYETDMFGIGHWDGAQLNKFANLMLQECLNIVQEQKAWVEGQQVYSSSDEFWNKARVQHSQHIYDKINAHFNE